MLISFTTSPDYLQPQDPISQTRKKKGRTARKRARKALEQQASSQQLQPRETSLKRSWSARAGSLGRSVSTGSLRVLRRSASLGARAGRFGGSLALRGGALAAKGLWKGTKIVGGAVVRRAMRGITGYGGSYVPRGYKAGYGSNYLIFNGHRYILIPG